MQGAGEDTDLDDGMQEFDPASMPLGTFAAFPVSDQVEWLPCKKDQEPGENQLTEEQKNAIDAMVMAVAQCEPTARRLEVQNAWRQELMDRGFHSLKPADNYGWDITGSSVGKRDYGPYGNGMIAGYYPTNVIGAHNDILVAALTRDVPRSKAIASEPGDDGSITAADAANKFKHFIANDNGYADRASEAARFMCTDDRVVLYMAPWADAQQWGYESDAAAPVPETAGEGTADGEQGTEGAAAPAAEKRPRIRSLLKVFGKLSHKCPVLMDNQRKMPWQQIADEWDIAFAKSTFPWCADEITGGGAGISEISLDRVARCTVKLALQRTTGDSITRDTTMLFTWIRPEMYMDESCPKTLRGWFWTTFPKGYLAIHAGKTLCMARNESQDECLTVIHSRTGNGQNRRSLTEAYVNSQLRLNNWIDLIDEFFRKTIPRVGLRADVWDVDKIRSSSVRVGTIEPFLLPPGEDANGTVVQFPMPTHQPSLPDFIRYFAGELAELLTGATATLSAANVDDPQTLGQSELKNGNSMGRLTEPWRALCTGFASATEQGVRWAARVQPEDGGFDSILPGVGRMSGKFADLQRGDIEMHIEGDANFPESWDQREARWTKIYEDAPANPFAAELIGDPRNASIFKQFMPPGTVIAGADAVEKQQGEFEVLLTGGPEPNPKKALLEGIVTQGKQKIAQMQMAQQQAQPDPATGQPAAPPPELAQATQMMAQAQQMLASLPDEVSSVPVRADGSENDAVEALVCLGMINSPEGRRLSVSKKPEDEAAWQNLMLHWQEHMASAKQQKAANQQPLVPKVSATVAVDKLAPGAQTQALQEMGLPVTQGDVEAPIAPHEITQETEGLNPAGVPTKQTVSMAGKRL